jgi:hypothetical protein
MAVIINSVDERYFTLNGTQYNKIYQPLKSGKNNITINNIYDTNLQLLNSTNFAEFIVDGVVSTSQSDTILKLLPVTYKPINETSSNSTNWGDNSTLVNNNSMEELINGINLIPATGEVAYSTTNVIVTNNGYPYGLNNNVSSEDSDFIVSLNQLPDSLPSNKSVNLVISWFGTDLNIGDCEILPKAKNNYAFYEHPYKKVDESTFNNYDWSVNGVNRVNGTVVSTTNGATSFGATPSDHSVIQSIIYIIKNLGQSVQFYPFLLMDITNDNTLINKDGGIGQPAFPWRGRMFSSNDKTSLAETDIDDFFGSDNISDFTINEATDEITYSGVIDNYSYRRMILHYALLFVQVSKQLTTSEKKLLKGFYIGSELVGLTQTRSTGSGVYPAIYPAVDALSQLANDVATLFNSNGLGETAISYAADWSEYHSHKPSDGSGDVFFNMDKLWSNENITKVSFDNYLPISDWREGTEHEDYGDGSVSKYNITEGDFQSKSFKRGTSIYSQKYLQGQIEGGENYHYYYASDTDRENQVRTKIEDYYGQHWVYRQKDFRNWWGNLHFDRPSGVPVNTATDWIPKSKKMAFSEFGAPSIDKATNQPNVFLDVNSSESFAPFFSDSTPDLIIQRAYYESILNYWNNLSDDLISIDDMYAWTWDTRPYPAFPNRDDIWVDGDNYSTGHWLSGRANNKNVNQITPSIQVTKEGVVEFVKDNNGELIVKPFNKATETINTINQIDLSNPFGNFCNMTIPNSNTSYTVINKVLGGRGVILINTPSEPVITNGNKIEGSDFIPSENMHLVVQFLGVDVQYFFIKL